MAIREQIIRAMRRSNESSNSSRSEANGTKSNSASSSNKASVSSKSSGSRLLTRTWTWGSNKEKDSSAASKERKPKNKSKTKSRRRYVHPSERPLTEQNLRHQELLSQFTWTFGASRPDQIEADSFIGISPCCTRTPSLVDYSSYDDPSGDSDGSSSSRESQLAQPFPDQEGGR